MSTLDTSIRIRLLDAFSGPMKRMGDALKQVDTGLDKVKRRFAFAADVNQASEAVTRLAANMRNLLEKPIGAAIDFETQMVKIQNVGNLSTDVLTKLREQVKATSESLGVTTGEIAASYESLIAAGFDVEQLREITAQAVQMGKTNQLGSGAATDLLMGVMKSFGLDSGQAKHAGEVISGANAVSSADAPMFADFLSRTGATARQNNVPIETMAAIGAVLKESGLQDLTEASTSMRNIINRIAAPGTAQVAALKDAGFRTQKSRDSLQRQMQAGDLPGSIQTIVAQMDRARVPEIRRDSILKQLVGEGQELGVFKTLVKDLGQVGALTNRFATGMVGVNERGSANIDNSMAGRLAKLKAQWEVLVIEIGEKLTPTLEKLLPVIAPIVQKLGDWIADNPELLLQLGGLAVAITAITTVMAPLLTALAAAIGIVAGLSGAWATLAPILAAIGAVVAGVTAPVWLTVGAIAALAAAAYYFRDEIVGTWEAAVEMLADAIGWVVEKFRGWADTVRGWFGGEPSATSGNDGMVNTHVTYRDVGDVVPGRSKKPPPLPALPPETQAILDKLQTEQAASTKDQTAALVAEAQQTNRLLAQSLEEQRRNRRTSTNAPGVF